MNILKVNEKQKNKLKLTIQKRVELLVRVHIDMQTNFVRHVSHQKRVIFRMPYKHIFFLLGFCFSHRTLYKTAGETINIVKSIIVLLNEFYIYNIQHELLFYSYCAIERPETNIFRREETKSTTLNDLSNRHHFWGIPWVRTWCSIADKYLAIKIECRWITVQNKKINAKRGD